MRNLGKIKLNQFSKDELDQRKMNALKGGCSCYAVCGGCRCYLSLKNGTFYSNSSANDGGLDNDNLALVYEY